MIIFLSVLSIFASEPLRTASLGAPPVVPDGFSLRELGREPMIQDPVAIEVAPDGAVFIAETERTLRGVTDNRYAPWHLEDDLQSETVEDRLDYMRRWAHKFEGGMASYSSHPDRVRRAVDTDGDGVIDESTIFAGGFQDPLDGIGAGVMVVDGEVWYANIPHLWRLSDEDRDGVAESREPIHSGFGVRFSLYGHDMHGLVAGPDGRIYWSLGDRGYHVETADGRILADPRAGAVFRCERDGSNLEVFATGLRNPQELAFNARGDLFTGDNTSDAGDRARIVFVAQDGETGWTMEYQTLEGDNLRGPWEQERIWEVETELNKQFRPDWTLPPIAHVGSGPSGFTSAPGFGLPARYDDHFFMCDFVGTAEKSRIWSFAVSPEGAGYRVDDVHEFLRGLLATDVTFDWEGRMLLSEWGEGWRASQQGRLHEVVWDGRDPELVETRSNLRRQVASGFEGVDDFAVSDLLSDPDRRVRLAAQNVLVDRAASDRLLDVASYADDPVARRHGIWGTAQLARMRSQKRRRFEAMLDNLIPLLDDDDPEVRAQTAKVMGDGGGAPARDALIAALADENARVRYHAAMSLGRIGDPVASPHLVAMLALNADQDRFLRHAGVVALSTLADPALISGMMTSPMVALRRAAVLVMRRRHDPRLEMMLFDADPAVRTEAARAVHDLPVSEGLDTLASLGGEYGRIDEPIELVEAALVRRVVAANLHTGDGDGVSRLVALASNPRLPVELRIDALDAIANYEAPSPRDRVLGWWRPVEDAPRDREMIRKALDRTLPSLIGDSDETIRTLAMEIASTYGVTMDVDSLFASAMDPAVPASDRIAALRHLHRLDDPRVESVVELLLRSDVPQLRIEAGDRLADRDGLRGLDHFLSVVDDVAEFDAAERRAAILGLGRIDHPSAHRRLLTAWSDEVEAEAWGVELIEASRGSTSEALRRRSEEWRNESLASTDPWRIARSAGNVAAGERIARHHSGVTCLRCHVIDGIGGDAGPALDGVGDRLDRDAILQSIVDPQATIVDGYGTNSAMPDVRGILSPREVRDLVAYLESLDAPAMNRH